MKKTINVAAAMVSAVMLFALAGCAGESTPTPTVTVTETVTAAPNDTADDVTDDAASSDKGETAAKNDTKKPATGNTLTVADGAQHKFGDKAKLGETVEIQIDAPKPYTPSESALHRSGDKAYALDVHVTNTAKEPLNPMMLNFSGTSKGKDSEQIFDVGGTLKKDEGSDILPGKTRNYQVAFAIADTDSFVVQVRGLFLSPDSLYFSK